MEANYNAMQAEKSPDLSCLLPLIFLLLIGKDDNLQWQTKQLKFLKKRLYRKRCW